MTATTPPHKLPVRMLGDLVSARSLEKVLQDAALARGVTVEQLWPSALADVLKHDVYRRLLLGVSPMLAKKRILDVLNELDKLPSESLPPAGLSPVSELEDASRRFTLYFDWPETQRLRGVLGTARTESEAGRNVSALVQEGQTLIGQMERRLQEGLVQQEQELAELRDVFGRVQPLGGKDVRRLESLIGQLEEAQKQGTLLPAELERARNLSFKLRRSLESSVMQSAGEAPAVDAQARVQALEQEEVTRKLIALQRDYAPLLRARPELERQQDEYRVRQSTGRLSETAVDAWRETLEAARQQTLQAQREELAELAEQLGQQVDGQALNDARADFVIAEYDEVRGLAGETIQRLGRLADALRAQRRLGPMSADARERYAQTLDGAEALLGEARAEYEAAQKVTATFGEDALDNLLDVFDFGGESLDDAPGGSGLFGGALAPTSSVDEPLAPAKPAEPASSDPFAALLGLSTGASASAAQPASVPDAASSLSLPAGARADIWQVRGSAVVAGPEDGAAQGVAALLAQADALGLYRLDMGDDAHVWSARAAGEGEWRLARAADWDSLDDDAGPWLDTGEL